MAPRTTKAVIEDHLDKRLAQRFEDDLRDNYGGRAAAHLHGPLSRPRRSPAVEAHPRRFAPRAKFEIFNFLERGEFAFVEWRATADGSEVREGADSFIVRGGRIVAQSIHYKVQPRATKSATPTAATARAAPCRDAARRRG